MFIWLLLTILRLNLIIYCCRSSSFFFFSSRRRHTRCSRDWSSDVCSSDLPEPGRRQQPAKPAPVLRDVVVRGGSGCGGEGDGEAEGFQLADVVAGLAGRVDAAGVVAGAQVVVAGGGVGEQVPDDHQDGAGDGDQGLALAAALDQAPVALPEEGVGLGGRGGDLAEDPFQVGVALAGGAGAVLGPGLDGAWAQLGP